MSEARYTPGPWCVVENNGAYVKQSGFATLRVEQAHGNEMVVALIVTDITPLAERAEATATLIAAAPTMADYIAEQAKQGDAEALRIMEMIHAKG